MNQSFEDNRFPKRELLHQQRDDYDQSNTIVNSTNVNVKPKRKRESTLRKAPGAPKRFKSSYIIFFMAQRESIKRELGSKASVSCDPSTYVYLVCEEPQPYARFISDSNLNIKNKK